MRPARIGTPLPLHPRARAEQTRSARAATMRLAPSTLPEHHAQHVLSGAKYRAAVASCTSIKRGSHLTSFVGIVPRRKSSSWRQRHRRSIWRSGEKRGAEATTEEFQARKFTVVVQQSVRMGRLCPQDPP